MLPCAEAIDAVIDESKLRHYRVDKRSSPGFFECNRPNKSLSPGWPGMVACVAGHRACWFIYGCISFFHLRLMVGN